MTAQALATSAIVALLILALSWQLLLAPPAQVPALLAAALHALPVLPACILLLARRAKSRFWGALGALILFSHGVMEAWSSPELRALALIEIVLAVIVVFSASWNGLRARARKRRSV